MLTMKMQGTVLRIFYSVKVFMLTSSPERLGSFSVSRTKFERVLINLSDLQTLDSRQVWKGLRAVSFGM